MYENDDKRRVAAAGESGKTLTKADIVERIYRVAPVRSRREAAEIVEAVFDSISDAIVRGEQVKLSGFGSFRKHSKRERIGRNPMTGIEAPISARNVVQFSASPRIKNVMNGEASGDQDED